MHVRRELLIFTVFVCPRYMKSSTYFAISIINCICMVYFNALTLNTNWGILFEKTSFTKCENMNNWEWYLNLWFVCIRNRSNFKQLTITIWQASLKPQRKWVLSFNFEIQKISLLLTCNFHSCKFIELRNRWLRSKKKKKKKQEGDRWAYENRVKIKPENNAAIWLVNRWSVHAHVIVVRVNAVHLLFEIIETCNFWWIPFASHSIEIATAKWRIPWKIHVCFLFNQVNTFDYAAFRFTIHFLWRLYGC